LQQAIKLLQLSRIELEDMISQELQENPALEEVTSEEQAKTLEAPEALPEKEPGSEEPPERSAAEELAAPAEMSKIDWKEYMETYSNSVHGSLTAEAAPQDSEGFPSWENNVTRKDSLEDHVLWQLRLSRFSEDEQNIGLYIIGNLDERGYLAAPLEEISAATGASIDEAESVLKRIHFFDPVGVAARDLRECLLVQLENLGLGNSLAARIVSDHLPQLEAKRYDKLARDFGISMEEIADAAQVIASLEPKPARAFEGEEARAIIPDVSVEKIDGEYVVLLNDEGIPRLRVSSLYSRLSGQEGVEQERAREYLQEKVRAAVWLIKSIHQRQQTLYRVTQSIFKVQRDFLEHGVSHLKPMVLRDVAEDIRMHESTVSRATSNKYVYTPQGVFELKFFFQSGLKGGNGEDVAAESVKEKIRTMIASEDPRRPFSDQHIASLLSQQEIAIARRTVAKYREAMGILPSSRRRHPYARR
jgi:RNA polymerase sigma-54 factor